MIEHRTYCVGDHLFTLNIPKGTLSEKELTPYAPFQTDSLFQTNSFREEDMLFTLTFINDAESLAAQTKDTESLIPQTNDAMTLATQGITHTTNLEDENGKMTIFTPSNGSLTIYLTANSGCECCRLQISKDYRKATAWIGGTLAEHRYALDTTLMLLYAFASSRHHTLLLHASTIEYDGKGYLFLGKSGTGKSTHSHLWLNHIPGTKLLNDDNPVIRIINGTTYVYGSPWSGKTPCYKNQRLPVGAIVRLYQGAHNRITPLSSLKAYAALLPSCSYLKWNHEMSEAVHNTISQIIEHIKIYSLNCLPDKDAVILCRNTIY